MDFSPTLVIGHRGWPERFPENSIGGIRAAGEVADMVEVDIRRTRDGELVLAHDPELGGHAVGETDWAELGELDLGGGERPPRLIDVLKAFPGLAFDLEVKNSPIDAGFEPDHRIALEVAALARPGDIVTCFYWPSLDQVRERYPAVRTGLLLTAPLEPAEAVSYAREKGHQAVVPHWSLVLGDNSVIELAHQHGRSVLVWTVNDPKAARELVAAGVNGIITDHPGRIRQTLNEVT